jgi:hypothetical protein
VLEEVDIEDEEINDEEVSDSGLPLYVRINPRHGSMWMDDISGLYVSEDGATDGEGNPVKAYARVPLKADCSRIIKALKLGILVPCDPTGRSKRIRARSIAKTDTLEKFMGQKQSLLIMLIDQIRDVELLSKMRQWEEGRKDKDKRIAVLQAIVSRMKSRDVTGVTTIESTPDYKYGKGRTRGRSA